MSADAVLIDLYDTLVWSEWARWQRALASRLEVTESAVIRAFDDTRPARSTGAYPDHDGDIAALLVALGVEPSPELVGEVRALEDQELTRDIHLYEDSLPVVLELRERGVGTALVSNCSHNTRGVVKRLGLDAAFDAVVLSFEVGAQKPEPEIYRIALERLGVRNPSRAVFVDDQTGYCDGAAAVGMDTRLIVRRHEPMEGSAPSTNGHRVITDLTELL
jgi:putative hydrolase of the HAD superfamily